MYVWYVWYVWFTWYGMVCRHACMYIYIYTYTYNIYIYICVCICISGNMYFHVPYIHLEYGHVSVVFIITIVIIEVKMYLISKATTCSDNFQLTLVDSQNLSSARGRFSGSPQGGILGHSCRSVPNILMLSSHIGVSENSVPLNPMVDDHYPY